jgi:adenylate cyclase
MDFAAAGLLDGLEGDDREARIRLLESLVADGCDLDELKVAAAEDRLALLPVERVLAGRYSAGEIEEMTGLSACTLIRIRRSLGLAEGRADEKIFGQADVDAARSLRLFLEAGFSEEAVLELTRVLGESMARLSAASGAAFTETFLKPGESEDEVGWRFANLAEHLTPLLDPVLSAAFRAHLLANVRRTVLSRAEMAAGQVAAEQDLAVCFADLVGFTSLGSEVETQLLGDVVGTFGRLAAEVAEPPLRLVKTIGDAAMLVSREPGPLVDAALSLVERVEAADLPAVRAGIAWGPAVPRSGDLYGHAVNLASRVTGLARPSSVLCTKEVRDAAPGFAWSFAGTHRLKGIADSVPLYRARRSAEEDVDASGEEAKAGRSASESEARSNSRATTKRRAGRRRR